MSVGEKSSTGLDANVAAALAYVQPIGLIFLFLEQSSGFVKFHALQSTFLLAAAVVTWVAYSIVAGMLAFVPILGWLAASFLWLVLFIGILCVWVMCLVKALNGQRYKLPYIGDFTEQQLSN